MEKQKQDAAKDLIASQLDHRDPSLDYIFKGKFTRETIEKAKIIYGRKVQISFPISLARECLAPIEAL